MPVWKPYDEKGTSSVDPIVLSAQPERSYGSLEPILIDEVDDEKWTWLKEVLICGVAFVCYYVIACVVLVNAEGWTVVYSIFFTTVSLSTVGYAHSPATTVGKIFAMFWVLLGIICVFSMVIKGADKVMAFAQKRAMQRFAESLDTQDELCPCGNTFLADVTVCRKCGRRRPRIQADPGYLQSVNHDTKMAFCFGLLPIIVLAVLGCLWVRFVEDFSWIDSAWWSFQTVTTCGYGDLDLHKESTLLFACVFILLAVSIVTVAIGSIGVVLNNAELERKNHEVWKNMDLTVLSAMDCDGDGVDMNEFVVAMLQLLELVDAKQVEKLRRQFHENDKDNSGRLGRDDLMLIAKEKELQQREYLTQRPAQGLLTRCVSSLCGAR